MNKAVLIPMSSERRNVIKSLRSYLEERSNGEMVAAVAEWYRHRIVAGFVTSSSPVPLKTRRVGQRCTLNLSRAETSSHWCGVVVRIGGCQLRFRPRHLTMVQNDEAHLWLNGYVNKQNCRIWSEANPQVYVETPLHPEKLTVWCALWAGGILLQKR
ncbi:uncharacterized protein TNCV_1736191 [Trichonephila clavipes]|nr:uncharacterized protein TNCV_1736191 [Trichonephila clavipes]